MIRLNQTVDHSDLCRQIAQRLGMPVFLAVLMNAILMMPVEAQQPQDTIQLNFPEEIEIKVLVDYVSDRLNVKIIYDESISNQKVSIRAPGDVPVSSLISILESALRMKGLALVDADPPGWKRIVLGAPLSRVAKEAVTREDIESYGTGSAVTQAFPLKHVTPAQVNQVIRPFLSPQNANTVPLEAQRLLVITDYADNVLRIARLIELIDRAGPDMVFELYEVKHAEATSLAQQIQELLNVREKSLGTASPSGSDFGIIPDERANQLAIIGVQSRVAEVLSLLQRMDSSLGMTTEIYTFEYIDAARIDGLMRELMDPSTLARLFRSAIDEDDNLLIVTTVPEIHQRISELRERMDIESRAPRSPIRFYKLKYADAVEVLETLRAIEQSAAPPLPVRGVSAYGRGVYGGDVLGVDRFGEQMFVPGPNRPAVLGNQPTPPPALRETMAGLAPGLAEVPLADLPPDYYAESGGLYGGTIIPGTASVTADPNSNSLIVVAPPSVQQTYEELIEALDRKRPQVLIEAKVVQVDAQDDFVFGVELSSGNLAEKTLFALTSFGLSAVDPLTGALTISPGQGFNSTLVDTDSAGYVLRALAQHTRSRVLSAPRVLINDNATGTLASVAEVPFTSINASNTVATTSFAGFAEAGTTIVATPRIADGEMIELDYSVSLNSFTGDAVEGSPPPRQTDEVRSSVTIPNGHTLIVGGLTRTINTDSQDGLPYLEQIPILRKLTSVVGQSSKRATLFVFLRPVILRDDKFRDLRFISERDLNCACLPGEFPESEPLTVREITPRHMEFCKPSAP